MLTKRDGSQPALISQVGRIRIGPAGPDADERSTWTTGTMSVKIWDGLVDDDASGYPVRRNRDQRVAISAGPCLEVERSQTLVLVIVRDSAPPTGDQHTPAFAHGFVDAIDLEADEMLGFDPLGLYFVGAEHNLTVSELEVHGYRHRTSLRHHEDSPYTSGRQVGLALLQSERVQYRVGTGPPVTERSVHVPALELHRRRVEGDGHEQHCACAQVRIGALLEISQVSGINAGTPGQLLETHS